MLKASGARQLQRPPPGLPPADGPCTSFVLCEATAAALEGAQLQQQQAPGSGGRGAGAGAASCGGREERWRERAAAAGVPVVSHRWLLDCLSSYTARPLEQYRVDIVGSGAGGSPAS